MAEPQQIQVNVQQLFATPVVVMKLPDASALNAQLKPAILARAEWAPSNDHSNLGGWQSSWDLARWGGAEVQTVLRAVLAVACRPPLQRPRHADLDRRQPERVGVRAAARRGE